MAIAASEAVPTPASTRNGTLVCSRIIQIIAAFWIPRPDPIGAPSGMMATQPMSSSRLQATGSSAVYTITSNPSLISASAASSVPGMSGYSVGGGPPPPTSPGFQPPASGGGGGARPVGGGVWQRGVFGG